jgi:hypothetical protein
MVILGLSAGGRLEDAMHGGVVRFRQYLSVRATDKFQWFVGRMRTTYISKEYVELQSALWSPLFLERVPQGAQFES